MSFRPPDRVSWSAESLERPGTGNRVQKTRPPQPLKNYARSLSHELRTPMHGIVGLLDIMQTTLQDASMQQNNTNSQSTFSELQQDIRAIQESSRRAVDAADNLVRAVELSMNIPMISYTSSLQEHHRTAQNQFVNQLKRRSSEADCDNLPLRKFQAVEGAMVKGLLSSAAASLQQESSKENISPRHIPADEDYSQEDLDECIDYNTHVSVDTGLGMNMTNIRDCVRDAVNDSITREQSIELIQAQNWKRGQSIQVQSHGADRKSHLITITWDVEVSVPDYVSVQRQDLAKILACLLQNAIKFTEEGQISIKVQRSLVERFIDVIVKDTGPGISEQFRSELFKPFSQEDSSITRHKEGLGLGLLVAKGLAQKLQGDLILRSTETEGPRHGSEFSVRLPFTPRSQSSPSSPKSLTKAATPKRKAGLPFSCIPPSSTESMDLCLPPTPASPPSFEFPALSSPFTPSKSGKDILRKASINHTDPPESSVRASVAIPDIANPIVDLKSSSEHPHDFAAKHPLNFLVVEDNVISRRLLVNMLTKLGYDAKTQIREASDGLEAVRLFQASISGLARGRRCSSAPPSYSNAGPDSRRESIDINNIQDSPSSQLRPVDVILMDLWMPNLDGYEATKQILQVSKNLNEESSAATSLPPPLILAVTADATQAALDKAAQAGFEGLMLKPFRVKDLERVVKENVVRRETQKASWLRSEPFA